MQAVHIDAHRGEGDCEDCGCFNYAHFTATFDDGTVLNGSYDGHLGNGGWDGEMRHVYRWCLEKLGYDVTVNGEPQPRRDHYVRNQEGAWPEYVALPMFDGVPRVIDVKLEIVSSDEHEHDDYTGMATVPALGEGAEPLVFRAVADAQGNPANWDGDMTQVWRALLEQVSRLTVDEVVEVDDDDGADGYY